MVCNCIVLRLQPWERVWRQEPDGSTRHDPECCYYSRKGVWSVSICTSPRDNGFCVSFTDQRKAEACAADARNQGAYSVHVWES